MRNEIDLTKPYDSSPYLDKTHISQGCNVIIKDVKIFKERSRPLFTGKFPFGEKLFDVNKIQMKKIVRKYGNIPLDWVGKTWFVKSVKYVHNNKEGLAIEVNPQ